LHCGGLTAGKEGAAMEKGTCRHCSEPLKTGQRKYCAHCAPLASRLWKRDHRRLWKAAGDPYWLTDWKHKTPDERRAYFRTYMRRYRRRQQAVLAPQGASSMLEPVRGRLKEENA
jgi:hypothetical protein